MSRNRLLEVGSTASLLLTLLVVGSGFLHYQKITVTARELTFADDQEAALRLLSKGAPQPVDARDELGDTLLITAAWMGHDRTVSELLRRGANVNAQDAKGQSALMAAAISSGPRLVEFLIRHGADVNARDVSGNTPLVYALGQGQLETVRILLKHGAAVGARNQRGETALDIARHVAADDNCGAGSPAGARSIVWLLRNK